MRVSVRDRDILSSLRPSDLLAYVRSSEWRQVEELQKKAILFGKTTNGSTSEVIIPLITDVADYAIRVGEVLSSLELVEGRSQEEILRDILSTSSDIIRIRSSSPLARDGSIPMDEGVALFERARDLMLSAASAAVAPRAYWPRRRPVQAVQYLEQVRLGQTERGSFVLSIQSPVPPVLRAQDELFEEEPFSRRVVNTLLRSLRAVKDAAHEAMATEDLAAFRRAIPQGVSANLCEALVGLAASTTAQNVDLTTSFSPTRPPSVGPLYVATRLSADLVPVIGEAARLFKEISPEEDFSAIGFVERLDRAIGVTRGQIIVRSLVDQSLRRVSMELGEEWYQEAVRAHARNLAVYFEGELVKEGRTFSIPAVQSFFILDNDEDNEQYPAIDESMRENPPAEG